MHKAVAGGKNFIISREAPFWARNTPAGAGGRGRGRGADAMAEHPTYRAKQDYITANNLVVYRFSDNWNARQPDPQLQALAKALAWDKPVKAAGAIPANSGFYAIAPATLKETAQTIKKTLKIKSIRCGGDPNIRVSKAALYHGICSFTDMAQLLSEPGVDLIVMGEPQWEIYNGEYAFDLESAGIRKGMIVTGHEASEEPGSGEMAAFLKQFITEVPIEWIPAGDPTWMPY